MKTKTRNILTAVLSFALTVFISLAANYFVAPRAYADGEPAFAAFKMISGAQIRNDLTDDEINESGIRFAAEIDVTEYEELSASFDITGGTFILPKYYVEKLGLPSEETCFNSEKLKYVWGDATATAGVTYKIIHVEAKPFKTEKEGDANTQVYRINGSVVNMKTQNLNTEYVGVSYVKFTDKADDTAVYYDFADVSVEPDSRAVLDVAQNILVNGADETSETTATTYIQSYIDANAGTENLNATVITDKYVNYSGGYEKLDGASSSQTVTVSSVEDFITPQGNSTLDGYTKNNNDDTSYAYPKLGGTSTAQVYFDKNNDYVIFDSAKAAAGQDIFEANGASLTYGANASSSTTWGDVVTDKWSWHGNSAIRLQNYGSSSSTYAWLSFDQVLAFDKPVDKLSFIIKNATEETYDGVDVAGEDIETTYTVWWYYNNSQYLTTTFYLKLLKDKADAYEVTVDIPDSTKTSDLKMLCLGYTTSSQTKAKTVYIDYIHVEYLEYASVNAEYTAVDGNVTVELPKVSYSTSHSDREIAEGVYKNQTAGYAKIIANQKVPTTGFTPVEPVDGTITFPAEEGFNYVVNDAVDESGNPLGDSVFVLAPLTGWVVHADSDDEGTNQMSYSTDNYLDGGRSILLSGSGWKYYTPTNTTLDATATTICLWIYSDAEKTKGRSSFIWLDNFEYASADSCTIYAGWNYYEITLQKSASKLYRIGYAVASSDVSDNTCIDRISFK